jgi:hypothetical protein
MLPGVPVARLGTRVRAVELRVGAGGSLSRRSNRREWAREVQDDALACDLFFKTLGATRNACGPAAGTGDRRRPYLRVCE